MATNRSEISKRYRQNHPDHAIYSALSYIEKWESVHGEPDPTDQRLTPHRGNRYTDDAEWMYFRSKRIIIKFGQDNPEQLSHIMENRRQRVGEQG